MENKNFKINITKPLAGWSSIIVNDNASEFIGSLSYIDPVPFIFLDIIKSFLQTGQKQQFEFDEEGTAFIMTLENEQLSFTRENKNTNNTTIFDVEAKEVCNQIITEIEKNLNDWAEFDAVGQTSEEFIAEVEENKSLLLSKIEEIKKLSIA